MAASAYGSAAAMLAAFTFIDNPVAAVLVMSLSSFAVELSTPVTWTSVMDMGGRSVGTLSGIVNSAGQLGGVLTPTLIGYSLSLSRNDWNIAFYSCALLYVVGLLCWRAIDPVTALDSPTRPGTS